MECALLVSRAFKNIEFMLKMINKRQVHTLELRGMKEADR